MYPKYITVLRDKCLRHECTAYKYSIELAMILMGYGMYSVFGTLFGVIFGNDTHIISVIAVSPALAFLCLPGLVAGVIWRIQEG